VVEMHLVLKNQAVRESVPWVGTHLSANIPTQNSGRSPINFPPCFRMTGCVGPVLPGVVPRAGHA